MGEIQRDGVISRTKERDPGKFGTGEIRAKGSETWLNVEEIASHGIQRWLAQGTGSSSSTGGRERM